MDGRSLGSVRADPVPVGYHLFASHAETRAIARWTGESVSPEGETRSFELVGISAGTGRFMGIQLADLLAPRGGLMGESPASIGPVQYLNVTLHEGEVLACVQCGLYLISDSDRGLAALISGGRDFGFGGKELKIEVIASTRGEAERFLSDIRALMRRQNVYRGRIISLSVSEDRTLQVDFHKLPAIERDGIVLPSGVIDRIERNTVRFSEHRDKLRAAGRHLKRGLLLHGQPGTGKPSLRCTSPGA